MPVVHPLPSSAVGPRRTEVCNEEQAQYEPQPHNLETRDPNQPAPKTISDALDAAATAVGSKPLEVSDARAIQSAEARATGDVTAVKGGVAAAAQSAVDTRASVTVGEVLQNHHLPIGGHKIVTQEDAAYVQSAEARSTKEGVIRPGGIGASMQAAADANKAAGYA